MITYVIISIVSCIVSFCLGVRIAVAYLIKSTTKMHKDYLEAIKSYEDLVLAQRGLIEYVRETIGESNSKETKDEN